MPIYEYCCGKCSHVFEEWAQHFDSPDHEPCPKCGGEASRIVSNTSFVLKGQGWYVTEYGNKNKTNHESGAGAHESDGAKSAGEASAAPESAKSEAKKPEASSADSGKASASDSGTSSAKASESSKASGAKGDTKAA